MKENTVVNDLLLGTYKMQMQKHSLNLCLILSMTYTYPMVVLVTKPLQTFLAASNTFSTILLIRVVKLTR